MLNKNSDILDVCCLKIIFVHFSENGKIQVLESHEYRERDTSKRYGFGEPHPGGLRCYDHNIMAFINNSFDLFNILLKYSRKLMQTIVKKLNS